MDTNTVRIGGKDVQLSLPFEARVGEIVGREEEIQKIIAAWMSGHGQLPLSPLLVGEPGVGKNRIIYEASKACDKRLYIFQGNEDVSAEDMVCAVRFSDDPARKMDYIVSPLVSSMIFGGICFVDEIAKIRHRALAQLISLLDERRYLDSILLGERIYAHPGFRFVSATNSSDLDESPLPEFIRSRLRPVIKIDFPRKQEIESIIRSQFQIHQRGGPPAIERFWELWKEKCGDRPPTARDSIYIFGYALKLSDFDAVRGQKPYLLDSEFGHSAISVDHLESAFTAFSYLQKMNRNAAPESEPCF